ncbi:lactonase family protein [Bdellovibrio sp. HCB117]|uniref:lactonase family protein n=1 Tax=Bdellovibrio sp. HCB117 TaxID=3394359 RepID=UPI0039B4D946
MKHLLSKTLILVFTILIFAGCSGGGSGKKIVGRDQFVYVLSRGDSKIYQYHLSKDGELSPLSAPTINTGTMPSFMIMDSSQQYLYVADEYDNTISQFKIGTDGVLTEIASAIATEDTPVHLALSPDGKFLYASSMTESNITRFSISDDGTLSLSGFIPYADSSLGIHFSPSGEYVYVISHYNDSIAQFRWQADGSFQPLSPASVQAESCPSGPVGVTALKQGSFLYAASCWTDLVESFAIEADGTLTKKATITTGVAPQGLLISGSQMFVANSGSSDISLYSIQQDGSLIHQSPTSVAAGIAPVGMTVDAANTFAYVLDSATDQIIRYKLSIYGLVKDDAFSIATGGYPVQILMK